MKKLFEDNFIYENLLLAYFSEKHQALYSMFNDTFHIIMDRFIEMYTNEDKQKGTSHIKLIQEIYMNTQFENRDEYLKTLSISISTLQRYRERYSLTLKFLIERYANSSEIIKKTI